MPRSVNSASPVGETKALPTNTAPKGYLLCNGSAISRTTYAALFAVIGTNHGSGDGSTTFNLPNYQGQFLRGVSGSSGNDPDASSRTAMASGGATGNNPGSIQGDVMQGHNHSISDPMHTHTDSGHSHQEQYDSRYSLNRSGDGISYGLSTAAVDAGSAQTTGSGNANIQASSTGITVQSPTTDGTNGTPRTSSETRAKNAYTNYFIRY